MLKLFVGTDVALGSQTMQFFVVGIRSTFVVSAVLCVAAAFLSFVRGPYVPRICATLSLSWRTVNGFMMRGASSRFNPCEAMMSSVYPDM
jgi:hypothetical protein